MSKKALNLKARLEAYIDLVGGFASATSCSERRDRRPKDGGYPYIPLPASSFWTLFDEAHALFLKDFGRYPRTFLEVGCGYGVYTQIISRLGIRATGLELRKRYIARSKRLLSWHAANSYYWDRAIIQGNALKFDRYGDYDLIYFYQPFHRPDLAQEFCERVASQAKGVVFGDLVGMYKPFHDEDRRKRGFAWSSAPSAMKGYLAA